MRVRPSAILQEDIIKYLGWTVEEASKQLKIPIYELAAMLENRIPMSREFAMKLELAGFGIEKSWLKIEERAPLLLYDLHKVPCGMETMDAREIPEPFQSQFRKAMIGSTVPSACGNIYYAEDWLDWASGNWRWGNKPNQPIEE